MRAVSTVLDATLFLLLVTGAVGILVHAPTAEPSSDDADATANVVASSTARVEYPTPTHAESAATTRRWAHGTLAALLADAAVGNATHRGVELSGATDGFERAVRRTVRRKLDTIHSRVQVLARWEPYPSATVSGSVAVGDRPDPQADTHAAAVTVPSGFPAVRSEAVAAARDGGFRAVAATVARGIVDGLFPPSETRRALSSSASERDETANRYRRVASAMEVSIQRPETPARVTAANRALVTALRDPIESALRARYDAPADAARAVAVGRVRITVRTWER